jgi:polyhydroxybutyrate depolymerase
VYNRKAQIFGTVKRRTRNVILWIVAVVVGVPVVLVAGLLAWGYLADSTNGSLVSSGITRRYLLYVPKSYDRSKPAPLIISIHPAATWPAFERNISRWNDVADQHGLIVVYPAGSGAFFGGFTRGQHVWPAGPITLPRDVKFISDLIDKLEAEYNIDPNRIYADGMSNGGGMALLLSCELPDRIAAVGAVSPALPAPWDCRLPRPIATVLFHGTGDKFAPYEGGKSPIAPEPFARIPDWTFHVSQRNQCQGNPSDIRVAPGVRRLAYSRCADHADVVLYTIEGGGHAWPGGKHLPEWIAGHTTDEIKASQVMWEFFAQHPRGTR